VHHLDTVISVEVELAHQLHSRLRLGFVSPTPLCYPIPAHALLWPFYCLLYIFLSLLWRFLSIIYLFGLVDVRSPRDPHLVVAGCLVVRTTTQHSYGQDSLSVCMIISSCAIHFDSISFTFHFTLPSETRCLPSQQPALRINPWTLISWTDNVSYDSSRNDEVQTGSPILIGKIVIVRNDSTHR